jgi:hypothetical protein
MKTKLSCALATFLAVVGFLVPAGPAQAASYHFTVVTQNCSGTTASSTSYTGASDATEAWRVAVKAYANGQSYSYVGLYDLDYGVYLGQVYHGSVSCTASDFGWSFAVNVRPAKSGETYEVDRMRCDGSENDGTHAWFSNGISGMTTSLITMQSTNGYQQVQLSEHDGSGLYRFAGNARVNWRHDTITGGC